MTVRTFTLDELKRMHASAALLPSPAPDVVRDLIAFARELLTERDEARDRLLRAWGEVSGWQHGEDCPAQYRDNPDDRDSDTCDEDGPVECDCGMDDLWSVLDVRQALPDTPPRLADAWARNKALAAERDALRKELVECAVIAGTNYSPDSEPSLHLMAVEEVSGLRACHDELAAERDALRATVDRLRLVVNGDGPRIADETIDDAIDVCEDADELADYLAAKRAIRALRALLADAPAEVPDVG